MPRFVIVPITLLFIALLPCISYANATEAGEIPAGGIEFKKENNISIENEYLFISKNKIEVSYVFKNHSDSDITTIVAFPVPEYDFNDVLTEIHDDVAFRDFTVAVNSKNVNYNEDVRAVFNGKDVSKMLQDMNVAVNDYGGYELEDIFARTNEKGKRKLSELGMLSSHGYPAWKISRKYYWDQIFPANKFINIKISYTPQYGWDGSAAEGDMFKFGYYKEAACIDSSSEKWFSKHKYISVAWVSYILTTANNWQGPIKDFHLILEKSKGELMSLCFDYPITKTGPTRFESHVKDFVPEKDLTVYYFSN
jgi:Domain of unknown function (DUF4424)